jgi:hypothetical protein
MELLRIYPLWRTEIGLQVAYKYGLWAANRYLERTATVVIFAEGNEVPVVVEPAEPAC